MSRRQGAWGLVGLLVVFALLFVFAGSADAARCTGADDCTACKSCAKCRHCAREGGTCGVKVRADLDHTDTGGEERPAATHRSHNVGGWVLLGIGAGAGGVWACGRLRRGRMGTPPADRT